LKPRTFYSIKKRVEAIGSDGESQVEQETTFWQVLRVVSGNSRLKVISTVESYSELSEVAKYTIYIH